MAVLNRCRRLEVGSLDCFVESESQKNKPALHNKILENHSFRCLGNNNYVNVQPAEVHLKSAFTSQCQPHRIFTQTSDVKITNVSDETTRIHIIPPKSDLFRIEYTMPAVFVPGKTFKIKVSFAASEPGFYQDAFYIHTMGDNNLVIPLLAYPAIENLQIPKNIHFPPTEVGQTRTCIIPLHSSCDVAFQFNIDVIQGSYALEINPLQGILPAKGEAEIRITYRPISFVSSRAQFSFHLSQFNFEPLICNIFGTSKPGLERDRLLEQSPDFSVSSLDLEVLAGEVSLTEAERMRALRAGTVRAMKEYQRRRAKQPNLKETLAIEHPLPQTKKLRPVLKTYAEKKKHFLQLLQKDKTEEERNRVGWRTTLGHGPTSEKMRMAILEERLAMTSLQDPETACDRDPNTWRPIVEVGQYNDWLEAPTAFDFYQLKVAAQRRDWRRQEKAIRRFRAAVTKVVQRRRAERLLQRLAKLASTMNQSDEARAEMARQEEDRLLDELIGRPTRELPSWALETSGYAGKLFSTASKPSWETGESELEVCLRELNSAVSGVLSDRAPSIARDGKLQKYPLLEEPRWLAESFTQFDVLEGRELAMLPLSDAALHRLLSKWMKEHRPDAPNRTCLQLKGLSRTEEEEEEEEDFPREQLIPVDPEFTKSGYLFSMPSYLTKPVPEALTGGIPMTGLYPMDYINTHLPTTNVVFDDYDEVDVTANLRGGESSSDWEQPMYAWAMEPLELDLPSLALLSNPDFSIDETEALGTYAAAAEVKTAALELASAEVDEDALYRQVTQEGVDQLSTFYSNCPSVRQLLSDAEMLESIDSVLASKDDTKTQGGH